MAWFKRKPEDKRKHERIPSQGTTGIKVSIYVQDSKPVEATWIDISAGGVKLHLVDEVEVRPEQGQPVVCRFCEQDDCFELEGVIAWVEPNDSGPYVGVEFGTLGVVIDKDYPRLWSYFNRRKAFRVEPSPEEQVPIKLFEDGKEVLDGWIVNISSFGLGLSAAEGPEGSDGPSLKQAGEYTISLSLPPTAAQVRLRVRLERVSDSSEATVFWFSYQESSDSAKASLEAIEDYIMRRQRELRQNKAG
jgi:c-di-GMP-binding flagellar brake protein YcgR